MAIDHESPLKEPRLKGRRITEGDGDEPDAVGSESESEERAVSAAHGERGPRWLRVLLTARFYTTCEAHSHTRRGGERTMFCLDCAAAAGAGALCGLCAGHAHLGHRVIQIRRSSYSSVVRVSDVRGLVDMDGVQTYVINGARVVFLNERSLGHGHSRLKGIHYACVTCRRGLRDACRFCSLGCKAAADGSTYSYSPSPLCNAFDQSCTPPTPMLTMPLHRRKGIPHRAPFGNLVV
ncbi:protein RGF1 INDUCIBLE TRANSCRIPTION FACTOR 1-like [Lolium rigidum]|uniref:protein RGF1 INDUCIBLE TRANSCRIPTION FACTOR 1-like n=1 Tax=Lolium rigidum TaxID=89674 RepID=UPI001F5D1B6F|nr:protein RGF1 INDUCIBLE TRANSCRIPTION FACTOR 1-like [Lolium rigidum]